MTTTTEMPAFAPPAAPVRVRVLIGEDADDGRRGDKKQIAWSECAYFCPDAATATRVVEALRESDDRLRSRPEEQMLWDWKSTWFEADASTDGGGVILLGVAWYDEAFFADRRDAWLGAMHTHIYAKLGVPMENISVTHWVPAT